jgi:hypothetical protein
VVWMFTIRNLIMVQSAFVAPLPNVMLRTPAGDAFNNLRVIIVSMFPVLFSGAQSVHTVYEQRQL